MATAPDPMARAQQNAIARSIVLTNSVRMVQQIASVSVDPTSQNVLNIQPRNVGLTMGFIVIAEGGVTNGAVDAAAITPFGSANALSNVTYTDLQNVQRVQTTGYHLAMLNSARQGFAFGGVYSPNLPMDYGNNFNVFQGASALAAAATGNVRHVYHVPLAYSASDLRGAVYTNVVNAAQNLQIVINENPFVATGADPTNAIYAGNANGHWTDNVTITVYQVYRDQIPFNNGVPVLPIDDLNIVYDLKNTTLSGMSVNQDFPFAYPNMRQFLSTFAVFTNGVTLNDGTDVNYWSLESANSTQLFKFGPKEAALFARQTLMADPPSGCYYFDFRDRPIDTITFGNMTLNLNASTVNANAKLVACTEAFQQVNQIPYAASLSIGG